MTVITQRPIEFALTFGPAHAEMHAALGLHQLDKGYVVIEAPNWEVSLKLAQAIFGNEYAFSYPLDDLLDRQIKEHPDWYPQRELLRISWLTQWEMDNSGDLPEVMSFEANRRIGS